MSKICLIIAFIFVLVFNPITSFGDMKAQNPRVTEKEFYNMIAIDIVISKPDIEVNDVLTIPIIDFTLDNENGKKYYPNHECGPQLFYQMTGKTGPNGSFTVCYDVEKKFNIFKLYYKKALFGNLDLNKMNQRNQQVDRDAGLSPMEDGHSCPGVIGDPPKILVNGKCVPDVRDSSNSQIKNTGDEIQGPSISSFFSQLLDMLRSLFHFS